MSGTDVWRLNFGPHLPADKQMPILDIGCGFGDFLAYLEQQGYSNLRGVEIDPVRAEASRRQTRAAIDETQDLEPYLRRLTDRYALITLKSVIAHFPREAAGANLRAMRDILAPGGILIVETFNASRWTGPYVLYNDITHCWAYTEYSLRQIVETAGFKVLELGGERLPARRLSARVLRALQWIWATVLKAVYVVERGIGRNPTILTKYLVAVCEKAS
ncbi:MAG: class I SAM-dependent methyltransferase [Acidobacteriota bacterium]